MGEPEDRSLGKMLVDAGLVNPKKLQEALTYQKSTGGRIGRILVKLGAIKEEQLLQFVAQHQGLEVVSLKDFQPDEKLLKLAPKNFWLQHQVIPYKVEHSTLYVAMSDAGDIPAIDDLRFTTSLEVVPVLASERDIQTILNKHFFKGDDTARPRQHTDMREVARELEARGPLRTERKESAALDEKQVAEVLASNPAQLARALASLAMKKGLLNPRELADELKAST